MSTSDTNPDEVSEPLAVSQQPARSGAPGFRLPMAFLPSVICLLLGLLIGYTLGNIRDLSTAVVTVNGKPIKKADYLHRLELEVGPKVLNQLISEQTQLQFARKQGAPPTESQVDERYKELSSREGFAERLKQTGQTPEDVREMLRVQLAGTNPLTKGLFPVETDAAEFYKLNTDHANPRALYYKPEMVQAAAIISGNRDDIHKAMADLKRGEPFGRVAERYSRDKSAMNGGMLLPMLRGSTDNKRYPGLEGKLFSMKPGEQIEDVSFGGVWWVIRCVAHSPETTIPFEKVKDECAAAALVARGVAQNGVAVKRDFADFKKDINIQATEPRYRDMVEQLRESR